MAELTREEIKAKIDSYINTANGDKVSKMQLNELLIDFVDSYLLKTNDTATCADAIAVLKDTLGVEISQTSIGSGVSQNVTAPNATVNVKDSSGVTLHSVAAQSNATKSQTVADSQAVLKDALGNVVSIHQIKAEGSKDITLDDGTIVIKDSAGAILYTLAVASNQTIEEIIEDSTAVIKNTENTIIVTDNGVKAQSSKDIIIDDIIVKSTGATPVFQSSHPAGLDYTIADVPWTDSDGTAKTSEYGTPVVCGQVPTKKSSQPYITGQTTVYVAGDDGDLQLGNGADIYTLNSNNPHGSLNRFTLKDGTGLTSTSQYGASPLDTNKIIVDWSTADYVNEKVLCWNVDDVGLPDVWETKISDCLVAPTGEPANGWHMPNMIEIQYILDYEHVVGGRLLLKFFQGWNDTSKDIWMSTTRKILSGQTFYISNLENWATGGKGSVSNDAFQCRYYTFTELGL